MDKKIFAVFNQAGGCGKTTMTHHLGYHIAQLGYKVLLIDWDPQASITSFMGIEKSKLHHSKSVYEAIVSRGETIPIWTEKIHGMDLLPGHIALQAAHSQLKLNDSMTIVENVLKDILLEIEDYNFILIDCPPSPGILNTMALMSATHVIVPVQTQFKCYEATDQLFNTIASAIRNGNKQLKIGAIIPTMYDKRTTHESEALSAITEQMTAISAGSKLSIYVSPPVPKSIAFAEASQQRMPLTIYKSSHPAVAILKEIADNIVKI